jgi:hypothetical protein
MPLTDNKITEFIKKVVDLTDTPSENMAPADIKAWFDSSPEELRVKLNKVIDDLMATTAGASGAKQIGVETISGLTGNDVQTLLAALKTHADTKTDKTGDHQGTWQGKNYTSVNDRLNNIEQGATTDTEIIDSRQKEDGTTFATLPARLKDLDAQLAENVLLSEQPDYVDFIRSHSKTNGKLKVKRTSTRNFELAIPLSNGKYQKHSFIKDTNDDFIKHSSIGIATVETIEAEYLKEKKNYDSITGTWDTSTVNHYTTVVGATMNVEFNGTGLDFYALHDNRGGIFSVTIDGGTPVEISTHINTAVISTPISGLYKKEVVRDLAQGSHTAVFTFQGADPNNPPTTDGTTPTTARGWAYNSTTSGYYTFDVYDETNFSLTDEIPLSPPGSNKEFAIGMKKAGAIYGAPFVPDHGSGTALPIEQILYYDNIFKSLTEIDGAYFEVDSVKLVQKVKAVNPNEPTLDLAYIYVIHTANSDGLHCKVKIDFLVDTLVGGYVCMLPCELGFATHLLVSSNEIYEATKNDDTITDIPNGDRAKSFAFINTNGTQNQKNTVYAMTVDNVSRTFRLGKEGRREPTTLWLQHRSTMQKLYPNVVSDYTALAGETLEAGYTMFAGQVDYASTLIK